jgi:predicted nucleotidyltransferase
LGYLALTPETKPIKIVILIDFQGTIGWEIMDIVEDLDNLFGQEIDLVTRNSIKGTLIEKHINQDIIYA